MFFRDHVHAKALLMVTFMARACLGQNQTFSSGSTGADGPLNLTTPGTVYFNPTALNLHPAVENVFNFTTISIGPGVNLVFSSTFLTGPIYWLAQGDVTISGGLNLDGQAGQDPAVAGQRSPSAGAAGGYGGGVGGGANLSPQPGNGPGGGAAGGTSGNGGNGTFTGNQYLVPLIGGSGGGGGSACAGGGGGGAILIASSTSITLGGAIVARGASSNCNGGQGSGGAIRLITQAVRLGACNGICGPLDAGTISGNGNPGIVRVESFTNQIDNRNTTIGGQYITSVPFAVATPATGPAAIKVTTINGIPINANPFSFPDATINTSSPVTVNVQAQFIPLGTIPKIYIFSDNGSDQVVNCSALAGTLNQSTCSASITFPPSGSRGFVKATW